MMERLPFKRFKRDNRFSAISNDLVVLRGQDIQTPVYTACPNTHSAANLCVGIL